MIHFRTLGCLHGTLLTAECRDDTSDERGVKIQASGCQRTRYEAAGGLSAATPAPAASRPAVGTGSPPRLLTAGGT